MADLKTLKNKYLAASDGDVLGVTDNKDNVSLLGFKLAAADSLTKFNLKDGFIDAFEDTSGVDSGNSSSATRNAASYYSGTSSGSGDATGGSITYSGGNTIHTFNTAGNGTSTNDFVVPSSGSVDYLVVAGGGGGGSYYAGGGGAGGMLSGSGHGVTAQTYTITVGAGGIGGGGPDADGTNGDDSVFSSFTAIGGGGGAGSNGAEAGNSGGSGGGGNDGGGNGSGTAGQGTDGGGAGFNTGGGGGGKSSNGGQPSNNGPGGNGGNGAASSISGSSVTYAGGGGGGSSVSSGGNGGSGGGGNGGGASPSTASTAGTDGLGGGGGGGSGGASNTAGSDGGNGVVIVAYTTNSFTITNIGNMTLVSNAATAQTQPSTSDLVLTYTNGAGTAAINTDLKGYISRDNGTTYTEVTLVNEGTTGGNTILAARRVDISGQPAGTSMRYKVQTFNQSAAKETRVHAVSLAWS